MIHTVQPQTARPRRPASRSLSRTAAVVCMAMTTSLFSGLLVLSSTARSDGGRFDLPGNDDAFRSRIYAGASIGSAFLNPDTAGTDLRVDQNGGVATQLRLGIDVHRRMAVELSASALGDAGFEASQEDVSYTVGSVSALIYGLNGVNLRSRRQGWNAYGRLGFGVVNRSSSIDALEESNTVPILGAGIEYGFASGLGIRGEIVRVDSDAAYFGVGAIYRFGGSRNARRIEVAKSAVSEQDRKHFQLDEGDGVRLAAATERHDPFAGVEVEESIPTVSRSRWVPEIRADDSDHDGVLDEIDRCPGTMSAVTVNRVGCGMFDSVLVDVTFPPGTAWLNDQARARLDQLAADLMVFPEARIKVRAHTDSRGAADYNQELSARRAEAAVLYLRSLGIRKRQLEPFGMGESRPIASNKSAAGRRQNRRVEIVTLPNLSDEELHSNEPEPLLPREAWAKVIVPTYRPEPGLTKPRNTQVAKAETVASETVPENATRVQTDAMTRPLNVRTVKRQPAPKATPEASSKVVKRKRVPKAPDPMMDLEKLDAQLSEIASLDDAESVKSAIEQFATPSHRRPSLPVEASIPVAATKTVQTPESQLPERIKPLPWRKTAKSLPFVGIIEGLTFPDGSAALTSDARNSLTLLGFDLNANPGVRVAVMAHTDDRGNASDNLALSQLRAERIVEHLVDSGVAGERLVAEGYGGTLPLNQNVTEADRAANRRVEVRVID